MKKLSALVTAGLVAASTFAAGQAFAGAGGENENSAFAEAVHNNNFAQAPVKQYSSPSDRAGAGPLYMRDSGGYGYEYQEGYLSRHRHMDDRQTDDGHYFYRTR